eukprot:7391244-Karenia_brevis.AAC.1
MTRQRDLLPLQCPYPFAGQLVAHSVTSRAMRRRLHAKDSWQRWCNDGIKTINELNGSTQFSKCPRSRVQDAAITQIAAHYRGLSKPPSDLGPVGAFVELCRCSLPYLSDSEGPVAFERGNVALPASGDNLANILDCLPAEHSDLILHPERHMLDETHIFEDRLSEAGLERPFVDPSFFDCKVYAGFLKDLAERGILEWQKGGHSYLGVFFVRKKN